MIISITGKPCSGKGTVSKLFCQKFNFELKSVGDMMRSIASKHGYSSILDFQKNYSNMKEIDNMVDAQTQEFGKNNIKANIVFDSRLAWFFIPESFKVFIDVDWNTAGERLLNAKREHEKAELLSHRLYVTCFIRRATRPRKSKISESAYSKKKSRATSNIQI